MNNKMSNSFLRTLHCIIKRFIDRKFLYFSNFSHLSSNKVQEIGLIFVDIWEQFVFYQHLLSTPNNSPGYPSPICSGSLLSGRSSPVVEHWSLEYSPSPPSDIIFYAIIVIITIPPLSIDTHNQQENDGQNFEVHDNNIWN